MSENPPEEFGEAMRLLDSRSEEYSTLIGRQLSRDNFLASDWSKESEAPLFLIRASFLDLKLRKHSLASSSLSLDASSL